MNSQTNRSRVGTLLSICGAIITLAVSGCGGGGGGGPVSFAGRTYSFASGNSHLVISFGADKRFTIFANDSALLPGGEGAQGNLGTGTNFGVTSADGTATFSGAVSNDASTVSGSFTLPGHAANSYVATFLPGLGTTPSNLAGTYSGTSGPATAILTVAATNEITLFANVSGQTGGGLMTLGPTGGLANADNSTLGTLTNVGGVYTLVLAKLNGVNVNATITLTVNRQAKWTFLVYLNAANNLEQFGPLNFNQMEKVGSTSDVNMVCQWKRATCFDCGTPDWVSTRRYFVTKDNDTSAVHSTLVQDMGAAVDMGDWHTLRNFIQWGQQNYPADHYALVIWNHGAGWRDTRAVRDKMNNALRSVSIDDATNNEIQTWQLPNALDVTPQMDMVIFDASLMQMLEVAYEIRNSAKLVVGSEESPPGEGYVYDTFLTDLVQNPAMSAIQFGTQIVNRTIEAYGTNNNITQSELDLSKMQGVGTTLDAFAAALILHKTDSAAVETSARQNAQSYAYPENKDLWDYADLIKSGTTFQDLKDAASNVQTAIANARIVEKHGTINGNSHGLAIYVPSAGGYRSTYSNLALSRSTQWGSWLQQQP
ncbi:MAG: clostripain-related cysteine peptidase [Chthonomonadales bacterium]